MPVYAGGGGRGVWSIAAQLLSLAAKPILFGASGIESRSPFAIKKLIIQKSERGWGYFYLVELPVPVITRHPRHIFDRGALDFAGSS